MNKLILCLVLLLASQTAVSETLFDNCSDFVGDKNYQTLTQYLSNKNESPIYCQRLNNYEFIYTTDSNFYYCNFKVKGAETCSEEEQGRWYPYLGVATRFTGENGKRYVLFKTSRLHRGVSSSSFQVFFFSPKNENPRGYKIISFNDAGEYNGLGSDAGEICSNLNEDESAQELVGKGYEIMRDKKNNVGIRFRQKVTSCKTKLSNNKILEYVWSQNTFIQSKGPND
ncbi:MAG: hypothetical protein QX197_02095 [Methylococcaceae bacterium]